MRLLVVGATGRLGRVTVDAALRRGHHVTALVRDPLGAHLPEAVQVVRGNVLDPASFPLVVPGRDAVIWTVGLCPRAQPGATLLGDGTRNLVASMTAARVARLVCVSTRAPGLPGREEQELAIRDSGLDWVIIRPPRLGRWGLLRSRVLTEADQGRAGNVTRRGLGIRLVDVAEQPGSLRRALVVGS